MFPYDVFISYSHHDKAWVRKQLLPGLEAAGLKVCIDYRDFRIGAPSVNEMQRAVTESRKTILVLTPAYLASAWAEFENLMAATLDPANRELRLLPLKLADCQLPVRYSYLTYVDFSDPDPEERDMAWRRLLDALHAPAPEANPPAAPSAAPPPKPRPADDGECAHLQELLRINQRALRHLERQKTAFGLHAPPHVLIELEDKQREIADLQARLDTLACA